MSMTDIPDNWQDIEAERLLAEHEVTLDDLQYMIDTTQESIHALRLMEQGRPLSSQEETDLRLLREERDRLSVVLDEMSSN